MPLLPARWGALLSHACATGVVCASDKATDVPPLDWVMAWDSIHDMPDVPATLRGIRGLLKPGGVFSMIDIDAHSEHVRVHDAMHHRHRVLAN